MCFVMSIPTIELELGTTDPIRAGPRPQRMVSQDSPGPSLTVCFGVLSTFTDKWTQQFNYHVWLADDIPDSRPGSLGHWQ